MVDYWEEGSEEWKDCRCGGDCEEEMRGKIYSLGRLSRETIEQLEAKGIAVETITPEELRRRLDGAKATDAFSPDDKVVVRTSQLANGLQDIPYHLVKVVAVGGGLKGGLYESGIRCLVGNEEDLLRLVEIL
jgi:hypothetical protein